MTDVKESNLNPDGTRRFEGLQNLKKSRLERHIKTLDEFTKHQDKISEGFEQKLLSMSREVRGLIEGVDSHLRNIYESFDDSHYVTSLSEDDVYEILEKLKILIQNRSELVENFAKDLNEVEVSRANLVADGLKKLTDDLVGISHQLPDAIEKIVETEAYDLNVVLSSNRDAHDELLEMLRTRQVSAESEALQTWENARLNWRQLRHEKALKDFESDINSPRFQDPDDRRRLMAEVRDGQKERLSSRSTLLQQLAVMNTYSINTKDIISIQDQFGKISEKELASIQDCYNTLTEYKEALRVIAESRVEDLRKELHNYGALHEEPPLKKISSVLDAALNDPSQSELWRLGGGLKSEFSSLCSDLNDPNIVYDSHISDMERRLEVIVSSFNLKSVLEERGRLASLEKIRGLIMKLRSAPKVDLPAVLGVLSAEIEEILPVEKMSTTFRSVAKTVIEEIKAELEKVARFTLQQQHDLVDDIVSTGTGKNSRAAASQSGKVSRGGGSSVKSGKLGTADGSMEIYVDALSVRNWSRKLGILYYGSDIPTLYQEACLDALEGMKQQRDCNTLVDEVVLKISMKPLRLIDRHYKKMIDTVASYMENQASSTALSASNLTEFYLLLSKATEEHHSAQKFLDEKSEDELWDWKEDFRILIEDKEASITESCLKLKQSNTYEEIAAQFEIVLKFLDDVQDNYREYHSKACFIADKHPLSLIHEIKCYQHKVSKVLCMEPKLPHPVVSDYESLLSDMIRLNKTLLRANPDLEIVGSGDSALRYHDIVEMASHGPISDQVEEHRGTEIEVDDAERETVTEATDQDVLDSKPIFEDYTSLHCRSEVWDNMAIETIPSRKDSSTTVSTFDGASIGGIYVVFNDIPGIVRTFLDEKIDPEESIPVDETHISSNDEASGEKIEDNITGEEPMINMHADYPWLTESMKVLEESELKGLELEDDIDELHAYHNRLVDCFVHLKEEVVESLSDTQRDAYERDKEIVNSTRARAALESDPEFIRSNVPVDSEGNAWVLPVELDSEMLIEMIAEFRDCLIADLERESYERLSSSTKVNKSRKSEFTEELEDRIRTHWPRRGRVETQIKQPREAELLGHEEKTWRHIESIQSKMIELQNKFRSCIAESKKSCDAYVFDVANSRNTLTSTTWKTLAALQAVDAKVRNITNSFQSTIIKQMKTIDFMLVDEIASISAYALQFMKLCPPQEPGKDGGYSESELMEIETVVKGQCDEIVMIQGDWSIQVDSLKEQQDQSIKTIESFNNQYEKTALELALSEGLGQKYGAPRRRAQEKIRTIVARDEQSAGKIDELLAKLDFYCTEEAARESIDETSLSSLSGISPISTDIVAGQTEITTANEIWDLLLKVRMAMRKRVEYLQGGSIEDSVELVWLPPERESSALRSRDLPIDDTFHHTLSTGQLKSAFEEVDSSCRAETKQLYESEGQTDALGSSGIPDSLAIWLTEKREKVLGPNGYHEKAWKRVWSQIDRLELILCRKVFESEDEEKLYASRLGGPAVALRSIGSSYKSYVAQERTEMEKKFLQILYLLEKGREKHERLLRPRLGSPDAADELNQLDSNEMERSRDLISAVKSFQDVISRRLLEVTKFFFEDMGIAYKGLMVYLDSSLRLDMIEIPPDTVMPKKKLTLKRLRKAQRIRQEVAASGGTEDRSKYRTWSSIPLDGLTALISDAESIVDMQNISTPQAPVQEEPTKDKKGKVAKGKSVDPEIPPNNPSLVSSSWLTSIAASTCVAGNVSTGHRAIVHERDHVVEDFVKNIHVAINDIRYKYEKVLREEESWKERWSRQVSMLKEGVI